MKKIKVQAHERLTKANIERVIKLLEDPKPITKKAAYEILNIKENPSRLAKIIEEFKAEKAYEASRREKNRGKPADPSEIQAIIELYLSGEGTTEIAQRLFRNSSFVTAILERIGVPKRPTGDARFEKAILPENCIADSFEKGEIAWSAKYHAPCRIEQVLDAEFLAKNPGISGNYDYPCYRIYVTEAMEDIPPRFAGVRVGGHFAYAYAYDLGKLTHLQEYGINLDKLSS